MDITIPQNIISGILSSSKKDSIYQKGKIQLIQIKNQYVYQVSLFTDKQAFHKNYSVNEIADIIINLLNSNFNCLELKTSDYIFSYRITNKGKVLSNKRKNQSDKLIDLDHNKQKKYLIQEGMIIPPLIDLQIMTVDGKICKAKYDKYKQINRFLELIDDSIKDETNLNIIDFGCGKSYLTFILYYYLVYIRNIKCNIVGLDLKEDVIDNCNRIANKYEYKNLKFYKGDVAQYCAQNKVDMIITLHACDTATDYALYHAIKSKCKYIFSVPCCQHEINSQLSSNYLHMINKFGILKERFSSMLTDAIRANILQYYGYKTQLLEFVDFENSPKNILIRAVLSNNFNKTAKEEIDSLILQTGVEQTLYKLCFNE